MLARSGWAGLRDLIRTEIGHTPADAAFHGSERYYAWSAMGSTDHPLGNFDLQGQEMASILRQ